jgi:hypothetical protein
MGEHDAAANGPQEVSEADVQAAREKAWDAVAVDPGGPAAARAAVNYLATIHGRQVAEIREATEVTEPEAGA